DPDPTYDLTPPHAILPIVVIGAGGIVRDAHLPAYSKAGFEVVSICDLQQERAEALARQYGIPSVYGDPEEAIAAAPKNAVFDLPLMPDAQRAVLELLPDGAPVLLQKPLGNTLEDATRFVEICHRKK